LIDPGNQLDLVVVDFQTTQLFLPPCFLFLSSLFCIYEPSLLQITFAHLHSRQYRPGTQGLFSLPLSRKAGYIPSPCTSRKLKSVDLAPTFENIRAGAILRRRVTFEMRAHLIELAGIQPATVKKMTI
jgi:hypothetical protein